MSLRAPSLLHPAFAWLLVSSTLFAAAPALKNASGPAVEEPLSEPRAESRYVWQSEPARQFVEATPLGNGRLGAAVFGDPAEERIVLNENGMWSGSPQDADRKDAAAALPRIRQLLLEGKNEEAEALVNAHFTCAGKGSGLGSGANVPYGCYQTLGDLRVTFVQPGAGTAATDYRRELDLANAICRVSFAQAGIRFEREFWVSAPAEAIVMRLTADKPGQISFDARLSRRERAAVSVVANDGLLMQGQLNDGREGGTGVRYAARVRALPKGGTLEAVDGTLRVRGADSVILFVTAATDIRTFAGRDVANALAAAETDLKGAASKPYDVLRAEHVADYRRYFNRVDLRLGVSDTAKAGLPAPERLRVFASGQADPSLAALYFNFGRYLLISSSRPGGLPANLQGIWADSIQTPWNGDWHLNINVQMNYWPAEVCNLSELHQPLFALIESLREPGAKTAKAYYNARGWVAFLLANPWGFTSPGESASWGSTVSCSAWLCQHLWDHYLFTGDRKFLAQAYPALKGASLFYLDMLIEEPKHHWLVTAPSNSPENAYLLPDGKPGHVCLGPTADMQLLRYLFQATRQAAEVLGLDPELRDQLVSTEKRLAPTRIGSDGRIMEWLEEYREEDPHHRHVAHLWDVYPGDAIDPTHTPDLAAAARKSLDVRGDAGTGWSLAMKLAMWARLQDGARAHRLLVAHLTPAAAQPGSSHWTGGTYPNLFDAHPPFQIDGNFGGAAAIAEMLVQSRPGEIQILPALPPAWPEGEVRGLRARGGFEVDVAWRDSHPTSISVRSVGGKKTVVRFGSQTREIELAPGNAKTVAFDSER
ncbi:glycoside hydrolase [Opitutaceae bacterium EW11]|nr:glycoside hydrolase [Opitutaceae bacterium EW11]